jgi:hypothetical protein
VVSVALALGGCTSDSDLDPNAVSFDYVAERGGWSNAMLFATSNQPPRPHLDRQLGVFTEPARPSDALSRRQARGAGFFVWNRMAELMRKEAPPLPEYEFEPGRLNVGRSRRLLDDVGSPSHPMFAIPTENGWVCYGLLGAKSSARCERRLYRGLKLVVDDRDGAGGAPVYLFGLIDDSVRRIAFDVGGRTLPATVGRNAFTLTLPDARTPAQQIRAALVTRRGGRRERHPLDWSMRPG